MKRFLLCVFISGFVILAGFSEGDTFEETLHRRLLLAMSTDDYLVTPGDVYRLTYLSSNEFITHEVVLESDFNLNLNVFGKINAENLTFTALKKLVEEKIANAYPDSTPSMTILSNGIFQVYIKGEVIRAGYITAWGLTRLSHILEDYLTPYSSIRDIEIISRGGNSRKYDLFKAQRFGEPEEDPRLRPNDIIAISKIERTVQLMGEVRRPGEYQLLPGQELAELLDYYGDGFTKLADTAGLRIERIVTDSSKTAETLYLSFNGNQSTFALNDLDIVTVPTKIGLKGMTIRSYGSSPISSFVTVTGAVHSPGQYPYVPEKSYKYYLDLAGGIDPSKSTSKKVEIIDLYDGSRGTEAVIQPEDRINVPYSFSYYFTRYFPLFASGVTLLIVVLDAFGVVLVN